MTAEPTFPPAILTFHNTSERFTYSSTNYSPKRLLELLRTVVDVGYRLRDLRDLLKEADANTVAITFDDGYDNLRDVLPALIERFDFRPTVFVPTAFIGLSNSWDYGHRVAPQNHLDAPSLLQLAELGVQVGAHGHRHLDLTSLALDRATAELSDSKRILEELLDCEVDIVSYPFGRTSTEVMGAAAQVGYRHGFTMSYPKAGDAALARGRIAVYGFDTPLAVRQKLSAGMGRRIESFKAGLSNRLSNGTTLANRLRERISRSD